MEPRITDTGRWVSHRGTHHWVRHRAPRAITVISDRDVAVCGQTIPYADDGEDLEPAETDPTVICAACCTGR